MSVQKVSNFNGMTPAYNSKSNVAFGSVKIAPEKSFSDYVNSINLGPAKQKLKNALFIFQSKLSELPQDGVVILRKMPENAAKNGGEDIQLEFSGKKMGFFTDIFNDNKPSFEAGFDIADNLMNTFKAIA